MTKQIDAVTFSLISQHCADAQVLESQSAKGKGVKNWSEPIWPFQNCQSLLAKRVVVTSRQRYAFPPLIPSLPYAILYLMQVLFRILPYG